MVKIRFTVNGQDFTQELTTRPWQPSSAYLAISPDQKMQAVYHRDAPGDPWEVLCVPPYPHVSAMVHEHLPVLGPLPEALQEELGIVDSRQVSDAKPGN